MMNKQNAQNGQETRWYYLGPDNEIYGPYSSKDMLFWLQSGYFTESLPLRTENESQFHTLGEYSQLLGNNPFTVPVYSMDSLMQQINQIRPPPPPQTQMMIMPPGLAPPFPPPMRFTQFMPMPPMMHNQMGPNGGGPTGPMQTHHQMHSQPPSEPIDAGSLSHTPDSENEIRGDQHRILPKQHQLNNQNPLPSWLADFGLTQRVNHGGMQHQRNQCIMAEPPKRSDANTETDRVFTKDGSCQTEPIKISSAAASRMLSDLLGQTIVIF